MSHSLPLLTAEQLTCIREERLLFDALSLAIYPGDIVQVEGPNGSGKSTLLQLLAQFTLPNSGKVEMPQVEAENVYSQITYAAPYVELIEEYTLIEHLELLKKNQYLPFSINIEHFEKFIELSPDRHKSIKNYSSGMRQKIKLAIALLSPRPILCLDEPTSNLDDKAKQWFIKRLQENRSKLILIASNEKNSQLILVGEVRNHMKLCFSRFLKSHNKPIQNPCYSRTYCPLQSTCH